MGNHCVSYVVTQSLVADDRRIILVFYSRLAPCLTTWLRAFPSFWPRGFSIAWSRALPILADGLSDILTQCFSHSLEET